MTASPESRTPTEDVLARAVEDWVSPSDVVNVCLLRSHCRSPEDARDLALGLLTRMIATGLLVPGDIDGTVHRPWDLPPGSAIVRIAMEWSSMKDPIMVLPGDIVWLDASREGQLIGEAVLRRESG
ncbi:hypothetical protein NtRootA9_11050 [Arthrobacter sp. NtRootA9]|nr:hypothetical protein NtRootA9_11050 [Arthrobacter sp. NtRootA9]